MNIRTLVSFASGALFAVGLALSGMTHPRKVLGFLDVTGRWDPSLALVMGGAIAVMAPIVALAQKRSRPLFAERLHEPTSHAIDGRLLGGAALFGVGWGVAGFCPGPALVSLATGALPALAFVLAMLAGIWLVDRIAPARR